MSEVSPQIIAVTFPCTKNHFGIAILMRFIEYGLISSTVFWWSPEPLALLVCHTLTAGKGIKGLALARLVGVGAMWWWVDELVSYFIGVALLGSEPDITKLYSSKPGARRLLSNAGVPIPPYEADIFSQEQLLQCLSSLIADNISISRWIFKLPEQIRGRGFGEEDNDDIMLSEIIPSLILAYCDVSQHLPCYQWVLREAKRYGPKWKKRWAQENALKTISSELLHMLAKHAHTADSTLYPRWANFVKHFYEVGGLIEGAPPSDSITPVAVETFIDPTGSVKILSTLDQVSL